MIYIAMRRRRAVATRLSGEWPTASPSRASRRVLKKGKDQLQLISGLGMIPRRLAPRNAPIGQQVVDKSFACPQRQRRPSLRAPRQSLLMLPVRCTESQTLKIALQVLRADMMIRTSYATLQNGEIPLNCVRICVSTHILINRVIDSLVARKMRPMLAVLSAVIRHEVGCAVDLRKQDWTQRLGAHVRDVARLDSAPALDQREHNLLADRTDVLSVTPGLMLVFSFPPM